MLRGREKTDRSWLQMAGLFLGPVVFALVMVFTNQHPEHPAAMRMLAVACLMAIWWITEAISISVTALIPMVLFPLLGILPARTTAPVYFNSTIFLFIGGFLIALTMEKWNLHKRIALVIIRAIGGGPFTDCTGIYVCGCLFVHVDIKHRHCRHDATHRTGDYL